MITEEEKIQFAINCLNIYNLKQSYKKGNPDSFIHLNKLPQGISSDEAISRYLPVSAYIFFLKDHKLYESK